MRPPAVPDEEPVEDVLVRPFLLTGGRTTVSGGLRVESLVTAVVGAPTGSLRFEARRIVGLAQRPTSVAELASALGVPIGVVRVLVGDLVDSGHVTAVQVEQVSTALLERIRDRVRAL